MKNLPLHLCAFLLASIPVGIGLGLCVGAVAGCKTEQLPLNTQQELLQLKAEAAQAQADLLAAQAAGDEPAAAEAESRLAAIDQKIDKAIADGAAENVHSVFGLLGLSGIVPGGPLIENTIATLAPFLFKRPRKLFVRTLKGLNPLDASVTPWDALRSVLAIPGLMHSTPATAEVFTAQAAAKTEAKAAKVEAVVATAVEKVTA